MAAPAPSLVASIRDRFLDVQLKGDRRHAMELLVDEGLGGGLSPVDILLRVITPAQREIGRLWECNQVSVADEHVATAISQLAMSRLYGRSVEIPASREHVVIACTEGEWHDMGARVAAEVLEYQGFSIRLLGPSVPVDDLVARIRLDAPDVVLLSVTMPAHVSGSMHTLATLRARFPGLPVLVGGAGLGKMDDEVTNFGMATLTAAQAAVCAEIERLLD